MSQNALSRKVNGNGKVILDTHPESDQHQNWTSSTGSRPLVPPTKFGGDPDPYKPVLEISCGQKQCAQTHRHTPMTTRPCGLRRAGKYWSNLTWKIEITTSVQYNISINSSRTNWPVQICLLFATVKQYIVWQLYLKI